MCSYQYTLLEHFHYKGGKVASGVINFPHLQNVCQGLLKLDFLQLNPDI
jgi:hypothetical protein